MNSSMCSVIAAFALLDVRKHKRTFCLAFAILQSILLIAFALPCTAQNAPDKYALLIAVTEYDHPSFNEAGLKFPVRDAETLGAILKEGGYHVDYLLNGQATRQAIEDKLATFSKRGGNSGVVFLAVFGHGIEFEKTKLSYFCPYDTELQNVLDASGKKL